MAGTTGDGILQPLDLAQDVRRAQREAEHEEHGSQEKAQQGKHQARDGQPPALLRLRIISDLGKGDEGEDDSQQIERYSVAATHAASDRQDAHEHPHYRQGIGPARRTNSLAVMGMLMGVLAITCGMCCCYGIPFNLLGIIFSLVALAQIRDDPQSQEGRGLAIAGLVLSLLSFLLAAVFFVFGLALSTPDILRKIERL